MEKGLMSGTRAQKKKTIVRRGTVEAGKNEPISAPVPAAVHEKDAVLEFIASAPVETALQSLIDSKTEWKQTPQGGWYYGDPTRSYVAIGDPRSELSPEQQAATFAKILDLDDSSAQSFLYIMAKDLASPANAEKVRLSVQELLEYKGYKRQTRGDFPVDVKREEQRRIVALSEIWISVNDQIKIKAGRGFKSKKVKLISRLFELEIEEEHLATRGGNDGGMSLALPFVTGHSIPYAFRVALGGWAKPYRLEPSLVQKMLAKIGRYDSTRESQRYAMRIMVVLMFSNPEGRTRWRLGDLIAKAKIDLPKYHAERFRQYVENAFDRLEEDHLISSWQYANAVEEDLPGKRWLQKWLDWHVVVGLPTAKQLMG